jgi:hypothetical protein
LWLHFLNELKLGWFSGKMFGYYARGFGFDYQFIVNKKKFIMKQFV